MPPSAFDPTPAADSRPGDPPGYPQGLTAFVRSYWNPDEAASIERFLAALAERNGYLSYEVGCDEDGMPYLYVQNEDNYGVLSLYRETAADGRTGYSLYVSVPAEPMIRNGLVDVLGTAGDLFNAAASMNPGTGRRKAAENNVPSSVTCRFMRTE